MVTFRYGDGKGGVTFLLQEQGLQDEGFLEKSVFLASPVPEASR